MEWGCCHLATIQASEDALTEQKASFIIRDHRKWTVRDIKANPDEDEG